MANEPLTGVGKLLVRGLNWIGDAVMSLPTLFNLREALPAARITVAAPGWSAGIYGLCPAADEVIETPRKTLLSEISLAKRLRREGFDAALILPNSFRSAVAPSLARIPNRWGYRVDGRGILLTRAVGLPEPVKKEHTVLFYRPLLEAAGVAWRGERFELGLGAETISEAEEIVRRRGARASSVRVGFSPGAAWGPSKRWPVEMFARAAKLLAEGRGIQPLAFGSKAERRLVAEFVGLAGHGAVDLAGAFPELRHLVAAISRCALLICNDSGPMHIAAALGVPVVALFGPTDERRSGPRGGAPAVIARDLDCRPCYNPDCMEQGHPCMRGIEVETVVEASERLLGTPVER